MSTIVLKHSNITHLKAFELRAREHLFYTIEFIITSFFFGLSVAFIAFLAHFLLVFSSYRTTPFVFSFLLVDFAGGYGAEVLPKLGQSAAGASFMLCSLNLYGMIQGKRIASEKERDNILWVKSMLKLY